MKSVVERRLTLSHKIKNFRSGVGSASRVLFVGFYPTFRRSAS